MTYFNEFDPFAAAWLRQLMADGHLEPGTVDERSITDVAADDVRGHRRQHYFAGIGGWELALQLAGWPRERSAWTGSCPCQDFSSAGKRKGIGAGRDLWPVFFRLIRECRPPVCFGEQVASAIRFGWIDRVRRDLEAEGYAVGFAVLGAHSVQAPHQRQRLYWVADTGQSERGRVRADAGASGGAERGGVGDAGGDELGRHAGSPLGAQAEGAGGGQVDGAGGVVPRPASGAVWDHWRDSITIECRDGKRRRVPAEPGVLGVADGLSAELGPERVPCANRFPLAGKTPNRAGRLRGYGNAICVQTAALFVKAFLEAESEGGGE